MELPSFTPAEYVASMLLKNIPEYKDQSSTEIPTSSPMDTDGG